MLKLTLKEWFDFIVKLDNPWEFKSIELIEENKPNTDTVTYSVHITGTVLEEVNDKLVAKRHISEYRKDTRLFIEFSPVQIIKSGYVELDDMIASKAIFSIFSYLDRKEDMRSFYKLDHDYNEYPDVRLCGGVAISGRQRIDGPLTFFYDNVEVRLLTIDAFCKLNKRLTDNIGRPLPFRKEYSSNRYMKVVFETNVFRTTLNDCFKDAIHCIDNLFIPRYGEYIDDGLRRFYPLIDHDPFTME